MTNKGHEKTLRREKYVHSLGHGDGFMAIYICHNLPKCTFQVQLIICQICLNKAIF